MSLHKLINLIVLNTVTLNNIFIFFLGSGPYYPSVSVLIGYLDFVRKCVYCMNEQVSERPAATLLLHATVELGEKCYTTTAEEGREVIRTQLEELQQSLDTLYDGVSSLERDLQAKLSR